MGLGSTISSPRVVRGGAPAALRFSCRPILRSPSRLFCYATKVKSPIDDSKGLTLTPLEGQKLYEQARRAYVLLLFKNILVISVRPIISTSTGPIFTKFAGLVELWPYMNDPSYFLRSLKGCCRGNRFCGQNRPPIHTL